MTGPPIQQLGAAVLLQGSALTAARHAIRAAQHKRNRDGLVPSPTLVELDAALVSALGHPDVRDEVDLSPSVHESDDITIADAAALLGVSDRQCRRLATQLGGRVIGGRWLLDRQTVNDYLIERREA
ncbi:hypothetical protein GS467_06500 [Rhodococcus hoagii]|nr:hypothetical protein [Prescottella equi]